MFSGGQRKGTLGTNKLKNQQKRIDNSKKSVFERKFHIPLFALGRVQELLLASLPLLLSLLLYFYC